ncbi:uncharacterized protein LOC136771774 [Amia ocellicauda]|uniref:uncharacterized protein LOC136771774 n=1 Tax=Amia ocellicauda TaxID=2972642 RepID=UPI0034645D5C
MLRLWFLLLAGSALSEDVSASYGQNVSFRIGGYTEVEFSTSRQTLMFIKGKPLPADFQGRVSMEDEELRLRGVTFQHQGLYIAYNGEAEKPAATMNLTVTAQTGNLSLPHGVDLSLPLFTAEPVQVLFGSAESTTVLLNSSGLPGPGYEHRVSVQSGSLTLRSLTAADQGNYTVRDCSTNRTISTMSVSVTEEESTTAAGNIVVLIAIVSLLLVACLPLCLGCCLRLRRGNLIDTDQGLPQVNATENGNANSHSPTALQGPSSQTELETSHPAVETDILLPSAGEPSVGAGLEEVHSE